MIRYFIIFSISIILFSCAKRVEQPEIPKTLYLQELLQVADSCRFTQPYVSDSIVNQLPKYLKADGTDYDWAYYYFVKAQVSLYNDKCTLAYDLLDSAKYASFEFAANFQDKINLAYILTYQMSDMYKDALEYHKKIDLEQTQLTDNETLIKLLSSARLADVLYLQPDAKYYLNKADSLISQSKDVDKGLYYHHKSRYEKDIKKKIQFSKQALHYWQQQNYISKVFQAYSTLADIFLELSVDSTFSYLKLATQINNEEPVLQKTKDTRTLMRYHYIYGLAYQELNQYRKSNVEFKKAINILKRTNTFAPFIYKSKAQNHFALKEFSEFKVCLEQAMHTRLEYAEYSAYCQIHINNAKEHVEELKRENMLYKAEFTTKRLGRRLLFAYSIIVSMVLMFLFYNRQKINELINTLYKKAHNRDVELLKYQEKIETIDKQLNQPQPNHKIKIKKIRQTVENDDDFSSWNVFYEIYQQKYPKSEIKLQKLYPMLSRKDHQHLMCLHWGLNNEKIASIFKIKLDSVRRRTLRIKKNSNIPKNEDIKSVLLAQL